MAFKGLVLFKPFYDSISCTSVRPAQNELFPALLLWQQHTVQPYTGISCHRAQWKWGGIRHCLPFPLIILMSERNWKETSRVMFSLCLHPAFDHLDCSMLSHKTSRGLCGSLPQKAVLQTEIGNQVIKPSTTGEKGTLMSLQIFIFLSLMEILLWGSHF